MAVKIRLRSFEALDLSDETAIYADVFNALPIWTAILPPHFQHVIAPNLYDYQISFHYQGAWPPPPKKTRNES
ncbi:colicin E3-like toxin immunity protein [Pseudomonas sp.]|uniref:colicin E3-like toxin immunity protein n=1 Tax=Pseudomonas sp. TaxID=306 RepID=UPI003264CAEF